MKNARFLIFVLITQSKIWITIWIQRIVKNLQVSIMAEPPEDDSKTRNFAMKIEHLLSDKRLKTIVPIVTLVLFAVIIYQQLIMLTRMSQFLFWFIIIDILVVIGLSLPFLEKHIQKVLKRWRESSIAKYFVCCAKLLLLALKIPLFDDNYCLLKLDNTHNLLYRECID